jgi:splicing factor 3B subunit 1
MRWEKVIDEQNCTLTKDEINAIFPTKRYKTLKPPPTLKDQECNSLVKGTNHVLYELDDLMRSYMHDILVVIESHLLDTDYNMHVEIKERKIMKLLLKVKNRTPLMCKSTLCQLIDTACEFGPGPLFNKILPLLMSPTLKDQEHHLLVKVIDSMLYKLDNHVHSYVHKILIIIEPLLIDEFYLMCVETREIISNLSKAAILSTMIATTKPDTIDNLDQYMSNTTARAFSIVTAALMSALLPFLKATCQSKKSW